MAFFFPVLSLFPPPPSIALSLSLSLSHSHTHTHPHTHTHLQMLYTFDEGGSFLFSVTTAPSFDPWFSPWDTGKVDFDVTSGDIIAYLDNDKMLNGTVDLLTCSKINWQPDDTWLRVPKLKNVHVIFMNHLDVGYDGINPQTGFVNNVLNKYFIEYFPRAIRLAHIMNSVEPDVGFVYTTHPWLLILYLNCPKNFTLTDVDLYCPNKEELTLMKDALKKGYIACHAGPMNMQIEFMNSYIFHMVFDMIANFSREYYGCYSQVLSQRDVPGMTAAVIPVLRRNNIKAVSVGVNPMSAPPAVPKLFQWKLHNESKDVMMAMWLPGGYPNNPGKILEEPGGISLTDSTISVRDGEALVFAFRSDNSGPPESLSEIQNIFNIIQDQYPGAKVFASTLDNFVNSVNVSGLPAVYGEIGDTWIQGVASDPRKTALYRAISRALQCNQDDKYSCGNEQAAFALYLTKIPEHTWGLDSVHDTENWKNSDFDRVKYQFSNFDRIIKSWIEQRKFFNLTQDIIESMPDSDIYRFLQQELEGIYPVLPNLEDYSSVDPNTQFKIGSNFTIGFGSDGSVVHFNVMLNNHVYVLADQSHPLGRFTYHTYNESDFEAMTMQYDYNRYNPGYDKPYSTEAAHPQTAVYHFPMTGLYRNIKDDSIFLVKLEGNPLAHSYYGGPETVWIQVQVLQKDPATNHGEMVDLSYEVIWVNKTATRLAEATMFSFTPALQDPVNGLWQDRLYKVAPRFSLDFSPDAFVTLSAINKNSSFYQHAVEQVNLVEQGMLGNITIGLISPDVAVVCPIYRSWGFDAIQTPTPFPFIKQPPLGARLDGFAFNIHNNIWNTNYPLWYPFTNLDEDMNFKARFHMIWYQTFT